MKKTLIAIAALAAAGAASAQSSVTMYGIVDTGYGYTKKTEVEPGATVEKIQKSTAGVVSGGVQSSRFGFKGSEALGNGLSAVFHLEMGFNSANGTFGKNGAPGIGFGRRAVVGLKGAFGQVVVGRADTPMSDFDGTYKAVDLTDTLASVSGWHHSQVIDPVTHAVIHNIGDAWESRDAGFKARVPGVFYSGTFSGVTVSAAIGHNSETVKNGGVTSSKESGSTYGLGVAYDGGALQLGAALQHDSGKQGNGVKKDSVTSYGLGASYNFGVAEAFAQYKGGKLKDNSILPAGEEHFDYTHNQYALGVKVPFGATTLSAEYAYNRGKFSNGGDKSKGNVFALRAQYAFSKRTDIYAQGGRNFDVKEKPSGYKGSEQHYSVGLRHKF